MLVFPWRTGQLEPLLMGYSVHHPSYMKTLKMIANNAGVEGTIIAEKVRTPKNYWLWRSYRLCRHGYKVTISQKW